MIHPGYIRNFEPVIKELSRRGHKIHLCFNQPYRQKKDRLAERISCECENVTVEKKPFPKRQDVYSEFAKMVYGGIDYLRYFSPLYSNAPKLKERAEERVRRRGGRIILWAIHRLISLIGVKFFHKLLKLLLNSIPSCKKIDKFIKSKKPDLVLVTPLVNIASSQVEVFKSAERLGIRNILCVASWDNLTNKGLIRVQPDRVIVWNNIQKKEATQLHEIPEEKVIVTGTQCYDQWFSYKTSISKAEFMKKVGLSSVDDYLLYLCSSPFIAPYEVKFVEKWIKFIRAADERFRNIGILIRPHPQNASQWEGVDFSHLENVTIYPREGANPVDENSKDDYYNSIYYSKAVVGLNTSAMIEAGVLSKPVFTIVSSDFKSTQEGTIHFHYLVEGGLVYISKSFEEHFKQLKEVLDGDEVYYRERIRNFIRNFVRPHGLDVECTPFFVKAIEETIYLPKQKEQISLRKRLLRIFIRYLVFLFSLFTKRRKIEKEDKVEEAKKKKKGKKKVKKVGKIAEIKEGDFFYKLFTKIVRFFVLRIKGIMNKGFFGKKIYPVIENFFSGDGIFSDIEPEISCLKNDIRKMGDSSETIIVGPWLSEIGFEVLYWIPFLRWVMKRYNIDQRRVVVISRGGAYHWYADICGKKEKYVDILDHFSPEEFKKKNTQRINAIGGQKHLLITEFDIEIIEQVRKKLGIKKYEWLHPAFMYKLFQFYWRRKASIRLIERYTNYAYLSLNHTHEEIFKKLPSQYVTVKFYFSGCFPQCEETKIFVYELIKSISKEIPVVFLSTGVSIDEHLECEISKVNNVYFAKDLGIRPANNLDIQTQIINNSQLFIGTYGGFSYLAPFYKVSSLAFYLCEDKFLPVHLDVAYRALRALKYGSFDKVKGKVQNTKDLFFVTMNIRDFQKLRRIFSYDFER